MLVSFTSFPIFTWARFVFPRDLLRLTETSRAKSGMGQILIKGKRISLPSA
jgi:hypothetical protein